MTYVLYNSLSNNKAGKEAIAPLLEKLKDEKVETIDITTIFNYASFFESKQTDDKFIICGGDGTINRFVNDTKGIETHNIFCYAAGCGNDFLTDIGAENDAVVPLDDYIRNLPTVTVNGKDCLFVNGVGYGIDGYCCEVADELKKTSDKPINYSSIAIKGLLGKFKTRNAKVTVDGVTKEYSNVWLAPAMNGRYYGGGMMIAPDQNRIKNETLSVVVLHAKSKLKTLMVFPSIFKGEHVKHPEMVEILTGKEIKVEFDKPTALQIDGETVLGVTEYTAKAAVPAKV